MNSCTKYMKLPPQSFLPNIPSKVYVPFLLSSCMDTIMSIRAPGLGLGLHAQHPFSRNMRSQLIAQGQVGGGHAAQGIHLPVEPRLGGWGPGEPRSPQSQPTTHWPPSPPCQSALLGASRGHCASLPPNLACQLYVAPTQRKILTTSGDTVG